VVIFIFVTQMEIKRDVTPSVIKWATVKNIHSLQWLFFSWRKFTLLNLDEIEIDHEWTRLFFILETSVIWTPPFTIHRTSVTKFHVETSMFFSLLKNRLYVFTINEKN
jgi:hypothetical protein